jgi:hypothetical protein
MAHLALRKCRLSLDLDAVSHLPVDTIHHVPIKTAVVGHGVFLPVLERALFP